ncbi:MAG: PAS domain-containing protein [Balneolales bacterium]
MIHPEDVNKVMAYFKNVLEGKSSCSEYRVKTCNGNYRKVLDYARLDDIIKNTIKGTVVDIT